MTVDRRSLAALLSAIVLVALLATIFPTDRVVISAVSVAIIGYAVVRLIKIWRS